MRPSFNISESEIGGIGPKVCIQRGSQVSDLEHLACYATESTCYLRRLIKVSDGLSTPVQRSRLEVISYYLRSEETELRPPLLALCRIKRQFN
jgi:hypothetical protein